MNNPYLLFLCGVALCLESFYTPGLQVAEPLIGGCLMGWNLARMIMGDVD